MVKEIKLYVVLYYLPGCKWCKLFKPEFQKFAKEIEKENLPAKTFLFDVSDKIDSIPESLTAGPVETVPRVVFIDLGTATLYKGKRTVEDLINFTKNML